MKDIKHYFSLCRVLLLSLVFIGTMTTFSSCGNDDEPKGMYIKYYIEVEEEFLVDGAVDHTSRYYSPITMLKEVINTAYPEPNATGDDTAVITACDELHQRYYGMYNNKAEHLTCLVHLIKATMDGAIVKQSERLKTYLFDINPPESDTE